MKGKLIFIGMKQTKKIFFENPKNINFQLPQTTMPTFGNLLHIGFNSARQLKTTFFLLFFSLLEKG